jgi:hypothetical protein
MIIPSVAVSKTASSRNWVSDLYTTGLWVSKRFEFGLVLKEYKIPSKLSVFFKSHGKGMIKIICTTTQRLDIVVKFNYQPFMRMLVQEMQK